MSCFRVIIFVFFCLVLSKQVQAQEVACNPNGNSREMLTCDHDEYTKQDLEMNRLYKEKLSHEQNDASHPRGINSKQAFQNTQRAWLTFRDKTCLFEVGPMNSYGSSADWGIFQFSCLANLTKQRIETLKNYLACEGGGGCP